MIVDGSALLAILKQEPGWEEVLRVATRNHCRMSTASWLEVGIVADSQSTRHGVRLNALVDTLEIELIPVTHEHARLARDAYRRYGRGSGSPARLNFGDTFAYALSTNVAEPLLFVGDDFTHTDVLAALT